jgi:hypothetical protein
MFSRINISILLRLHCFSGDGTLTAFNIRRKKLELQSELFDAEFLSLAQMKVFIVLLMPSMKKTWFAITRSHQNLLCPKMFFYQEFEIISFIYMYFHVTLADFGYSVKALCFACS